MTDLGAAVGTMMVGLWWKNGEGRSIDFGYEVDQTWAIVERQVGSGV